MENRVLITGGSGMIGRQLTEMLQQKGYKVFWLSRKAGKDGEILRYAWEPENNKIDDDAILKADYIIHLAGANVFAKRWTESYKNQLLASRVKSLNLLFGKVKIFEQPLKAFISASAIGIYGSDYSEEVCDENSPPGEDYLAKVCEQWEASADQFSKIGTRTVKIRTGIVLSEKAGALKKIIKPASWGLAAPLGSGKQYTSWVHIEDLCRVYIEALENEQMNGAYNAVAPKPVTNKELTKNTAEAFNKPMFMPKVPAFVLKIIFGSDRAKLILGGKRISSQKLLQTGFKFNFPEISSAVGNLIKEN